MAPRRLRAWHLASRLVSRLAWCLSPAANARSLRPSARSLPLASPRRRHRRRPVRPSTAPVQLMAYKSKSGLSAPRSRRLRRSWRRPLHRPPQVGLPPTEAPRSPTSTKWGGVARVIGLTSPCTALASVPLPTSLGHTPLGEWSYGPLGVVCVPTALPAYSDACALLGIPTPPQISGVQADRPLAEPKGCLHSGSKQAGSRNAQRQRE